MYVIQERCNITKLCVQTFYSACKKRTLPSLPFLNYVIRKPQCKARMQDDNTQELQDGPGPYVRAPAAASDR